MVDLTNIKKQTNIKPPIICVYGQPKIGKTTFASQSPNPLFIDIEDGLGAISASSVKITEEDRKADNGLAKVFETMQAFRDQEHDFKTLVIDSLDWLEDLINKQVCIDNEVEDISQIPYGGGAIKVKEYWIEWINLIKQIRDRKNAIIILISHYQVRPFNDPRGETYDRYELKLGKHGAGLIQEFCDAIGFASQDVVRKTEKGNFGGETKKAIAKGRSIYWQDQAACVAGNRYGLEKTKIDWFDFENQLATKLN